MNYYFKLQLLRFQRVLSEAGIQPFFGMIIAFTAYLGTSFYVGFTHPEGKKILLVFAVLIQLSVFQKQNDIFLENLFSKIQVKTIKFIELLIAALPIFLALLFTGNFIWALIIPSFALLLAFQSNRGPVSFSIPTPFKKHPYELPASFRFNFLYLLLLYFGIGISLFTNNPNLGMVAFGLIQLIMFSSFIKVENEFFVWVNRSNPSNFIKQKFGLYLLGSLFTSTPAAIILGFGFQELSLNLGFIFLGFSLIFGVVLLMKYSIFPREISVPQSIILGLCLLMPFLIFFLLPYYFNKAIKNLSYLLDDKN